MLVLSRKKNERVMIGDDIEVVIVEIRGDKVRLGFNAPTEVPVHRREVFDAIKRSEGQTSPLSQTQSASVDTSRGCQLNASS